MTNEILESQNRIKELELENSSLKEKIEFQKKIVEQSNLHQDILYDAHHGIIVYDTELKYKVWNTFMEKITGIPEPEVIGKHPIDFFPFLGEHKVIDKYYHILEKGSSYQTEFPYNIPSTGKKGRVIEFSSPLLNSEKEIVGVLSFVHDITERKRTEQALIESEKKYKAIFENSPAGILIADDDGNYVSANKAAAEQFGYSTDELLKKNVKDIPTIEKTDTELRYENYIEKGTDCGEFKFYAKDGKLKTSQYQAIRLKPDFNISMLMDITDRKKIETELFELNESKDKFISMLAHDLKNPFNSLLGFSDLLVKNLYKYDIQKIEKQLKVINSTAHQTYELLEQILLWAKSQSGKLAFEPLKFSFLEITNEIIRIFENQANEKNIEINAFEAEKTEIYADVDMYNAIMRNLISNAIKFTHKNGQITVSAEKNHLNVLITVSDNGIGIKKEVIPKLWEMTDNYSTKGTNSEKGTGFGLTLCKEFTEKHGGKIWVESETGVGSDFKFTLPSENKNSNENKLKMY